MTTSMNAGVFVIAVHMAFLTATASAAQRGRHNFDLRTPIKPMQAPQPSDANENAATKQHAMHHC